ncbi:LysR family transcriptional regulator [Achromobacter insolitus]|nr:LysR family transcriptional regulator [Achromobacter insolitus]
MPDPHSPSGQESAHLILSRLKLRHLRIIGALGEVQTAAAVARRFHVSPAAISKSLAEIEAIVGAPLWEGRGRRGLALTDLGREMANHATVLLVQLERLAESMSAIQKGGKGELRLASRTLSVHPLLCHALATFNTDRPGVTVRMVEGGIVELIEQLVDGSLDILFTYADPRLDLASLSTVRILPAQKVVVIASRDHPLLARRRITADMLARQRWCIPNAGSRIFHLLQTALHHLGVALPSEGVHTSDVSVTASLLQAGDYLAVFPEGIAEQLCTAKVARRVRFDLGGQVEPVVAVWNKQVTARPAAQLFRQLVVDCANSGSEYLKAPLLGARAVTAPRQKM